MTWPQAEAWCVSNGRHLVSIFDAKTNAAAAKACSDCWIGGTDSLVENKWAWSDGNGWSYTNWAPGEPNDWGNAEDCVQMYSNGKWNDNQCSGPSRQRPLCGPKDDGSTPTTTSSTTSTTSTTTTSPDFLVGSSTMTWTDAEAWCVSNGRHLASILDANMNAAAVKACGGTCWIGGTDALVEDDWAWSDGNGWSYTNWAPGEPNDWGNAEDCVQMYSKGMWNDNRCSGSRQRPLCGPKD